MIMTKTTRLFTGFPDGGMTMSLHRPNKKIGQMSYWPPLHAVPTADIYIYLKDAPPESIDIFVVLLKVEI
jgi:hypothetical protein